MYSHFHSDFFYDYLDHRAYLPMIGILIILAELIPKAWIDLRKNKVFYINMSIIIFFAAYTVVQARNYTDPITFWTSAANSNPKVAGFHLVLGELLLRSNRLDEAEKQFLISLKYKPEVIDSYCYLGEIYSKQQRYARSVNVLRMGIKIDSLNYFAYNQMGKNYQMLEMHDKAVEAWKMAYQIDGSKTIILKNIIKAYSAINQYQKAVPYLELLEKKADDYTSFAPEFYFKWAESLGTQNIDILISTLNKALALDNSSEPYNRGGIILMNANLPQKALEYWNHSLESNPNNVRVLQNLLQFHLMIDKDMYKAKEYAQRIQDNGAVVPPHFSEMLKGF